MTNIENLYSYTTAQFEAVDHLLTMGVGAHFAALVFFLLMSRYVAPAYLAATALSCIVMVSAGLILYGQADLWSEVFRWDGQAYTLSEQTFSNGYRYVNWMVTIPCLLTQLLIILGIRGRQLVGDATKLILAAWGMIITGYIGQLYETSDISQLLLWGAVSTVFFVYMNYLVGIRIFRTIPRLPQAVSPLFRRIFWLMMFAWTLYPIAYLIPWLADSADSVVLRQGLFTLADVSSKVVYGLMITYVAIRRSAVENFEPAVQMLKTTRSFVNQRVNA
ncbi:MAG: bacteriorhodopsin [Cyclobacteriaceae bacterium]